MKVRKKFENDDLFRLLLILPKETGDYFIVRNMLVENNLGLAATWAKRYQRGLYTVDEIFSVAYLALIKAVESYQLDRSIFSSYATTAIRWEIQKMYSHDRLIPIPERSNRTKVRGAKNKTDRLMLEKSNYTIQRLFDNVAERLKQEDYEFDVYEKLTVSIKKLKEPIQTIIYLRFFESMTLEEIGSRLVKTRERIRQLEQIGLKQLKKMFESNHQKN